MLLNGELWTALPTGYSLCSIGVAASAGRDLEPNPELYITRDTCVHRRWVSPKCHKVRSWNPRSREHQCWASCEGGWLVLLHHQPAISILRVGGGAEWVEQGGGRRGEAWEGAETAAASAIES